MADPTVDRDPVEMLAADFMDRLRAGKHPSIEEYATAHPACAEEIRELFPTIAAMEKLKSDKESLSGGRASLGPVKIERLGDLRIIREIGRGGMGIVYEAEQESLGRRVAVKVLPKQALLDDKHLRRFRREAKTAAKLHHTNIVPVLGVGEHEGYHYYVMQIIRGVGLDEVIPQLQRISGSDSSRASSRISNVSGVAEALVCGQLQSLAKAVDSSQNAGGNSGSTGSHSAALTAIGQGDNESGGAVTTSGQLDHDAGDFDIELPAAIHGRSAFGASYWHSVARIGRQVANALQYAHRQATLHRDIKPANLLIDERGTVWVADFGLAKAMEQDDVSRSGDIVGTLRYMAPEQFEGTADARSDIYSLGLTLYELLTLQPAYDEKERKRSFIQQSGMVDPIRPRRINPAIPRDLETIVLKAMTSEPERRYQSAGALADDLERYLEDRPIQARRVTPVERLWRWGRRNPAIATLSGVAASLLLLVAVVQAVGNYRLQIANAAEITQRKKAEVTSEVAWDALDRIFERLTPHHYVSPEDFAVDTGNDEELNIQTEPVLSEETAAWLEEMLAVYDRLAEQGDDNESFRQRIAEANRKVGDIRERLGQYDQAEQAYRKAIGFFSRLDEESQTPKTVAIAASIENDLGELLSKARRHDEAQIAFDEARRALEPLVDETDLPEVRYELARTYYLQSARSARMGGRGRGDGKQRGPRRNENAGPPPSSREATHQHNGEHRDYENLSRAVQLLESLTAQYDVPDYQQLLALCYVKQHRYLRYEDRQQAQAAIDKAIGLLKSLVKQFPANPDYRFTLSKVYAEGLFSGRPGQEELAATEQQGNAALQLLEDLHRNHPSVPDYLVSQIGIHHSMAMLESRFGNFEKAAPHYLEAIKLSETLGQSHPDDLGRKAWLNFIHQSYSHMLVEQFKAQQKNGEATDSELLTKARGQIEESQTLLRPLVDKDPRLRGLLGLSYKLLSETYSLTGDKENADRARETMKTYLPKDRWSWGGPWGRDRRRENDETKRGERSIPPPPPPPPPLQPR